MKQLGFIAVASFVSAFLCFSLAPTIGTLAEGEEPSSSESSSSEEGPLIPVPAGYTRYEAEDAQLTDCTAKGKMEGAPADYGSYSGMGFVGSIDFATSNLVFAINAVETGNYDCRIGYAIDAGFSNAAMNVYIGTQTGTNPTSGDPIIEYELFQTWTFTQKNGWGSFAETVPLMKSLNLTQGVNYVKLHRGYGWVEFDYIDVCNTVSGSFIDPSGEVAEIAVVPAGYTRYEAENGTISGGTYNRTVGSCSGTGYVGQLDFNGTSGISWTINAPEKGEYDVRVAYAIGVGYSDASFKIFNDNGFYGIVTMTVKNGWGVFTVDGIATSKISLEAGVNHVSLMKSAYYAELDFIDISNAKTGEWKECGYELSYPNQKDGYVRHEAEEQIVVLAETKGIGYFVDMGHYSGKGFVGCLDNDSMYIEFPVNVAEDGEYAIRVAYAGAEADGQFRLYSGQYGRGGNCYYYETVTVDTVTDWGEFTSETIVETTISIKAGKSYVLVRGGFPAVEIDYIDFGAKVGEYKEGTYEASLDRANPL